jgi:hypothetical protein
MAGPASNSSPSKPLCNVHSRDRGHSQEYIRFLDSPTGRKYVRAGWDAFQSAMEQGGADTGTRFAEILRQKN